MKNIIKQIPFVKRYYQLYKEEQYKSRFATDYYGCFWGVFNTFDEAIQAAPKVKSFGYNNEELAQEYQQMLEDNNWENQGRSIFLYDYPMLFWLSSIINQGNTNIFDFGGNVGVHYYSYTKYLSNTTLKWTVCDLPEIIKAGKRIVEKRAIKDLEFTSEFADIKSKDIMIAAGVIQYIENLAKKLSTTYKPQHLLINRVPLYDGEQFVTLQNGGKVFYPQYIFNKTEFIDGLINIGYELIDIWEGTGSCIIPFHPDKSVYSYSGLYLRLMN
ncbi:MAG: methyltransferase, TIGR04325 family [Calothrix sp. FI2-JRJ7]|jgi:putative methyltransferase (TIGR04325 family)|nr:methyltransferase, TIGR04325 family [Calothrix sp. FI2-JRJ7]